MGGGVNFIRYICTYSNKIPHACKGSGSLAEVLMPLCFHLEMFSASF
jgi:hypothetical protein